MVENTNTTIAIAQKIDKPSPGLYIVSTPIGNLRDITLRALDVLNTADVIACEDTRVTGKLLNAYGIKTPMSSYHEHNAGKMRSGIISQIESGDVVALVSDAGTPLISDPGYKLVQECLDKGVLVTATPGASAILGALSISGVTTDRFSFGGFIPQKKKAKQDFLSEWKTVHGTLVFYESAKRLIAGIEGIKDVFGDVSIVVARELTKKFEEVKRGTASELLGYYQSQGAPRGEIVLIIQNEGKSQNFSIEEIDGLIFEALNEQELHVKDVAVSVALQTGKSKKEIYARVIELRDADKNE